MAYRYGDRKQIEMFPPCLEDYVPKDAPVRANASIKHSWTKERAQKALAQLDRRIGELLTECETVDQQEQQDGSWVRRNEEWADAQALKAKVKAVLAELQAEEKPSVNTTDPDCVRVHGRQGSHAGYNSQIVVDDENGLIVNSDVVSVNNDSGQFGTQITQANEVLEEPCKAGCGDAGFADYEDLADLADEMDVIVPSQRQAQKNPTEPGPFDKSCFTYDPNTDTYLCPTGHTLVHRSYEKQRKRHCYTGGSTCLSCEHFGSCTTDRVNGRKVTRSDYETVREKLEERYKQPDAQAIFRRRKEKVEHPFGHIKRNLHRGYFLLRGMAGVRAEMSLLACAFNVTRMISLVGVTELVTQLAG